MRPRPSRPVSEQPLSCGVLLAATNSLSREIIHMPYLAGIVTGALLTVLVVFLVDNLSVVNAPAGTEPQKIVNWDVAPPAEPSLGAPPEVAHAKQQQSPLYS